MKIRDIAEVIERYAPLRLQESYDNAGLIVAYQIQVARIYDYICKI